MESPLIYSRIKNKARKSNIAVPPNHEEILRKYKNVGNLEGNRIVFSWLSDTGNTILNASSMVPGCVVFNAEWAAQVVLYDSEETMNAFKITVGHELTHKDNEIAWWRYWRRAERQFVAQVNEVRADFGGNMRMCGSNRETLLNAINYKKQLRAQDNGDFLHPPWYKRYEYVERYDFGAELINKIADDVGCYNQGLREYVINHYSDIILTPPPKIA